VLPVPVPSIIVTLPSVPMNTKLKPPQLGAFVHGAFLLLMFFLKDWYSGPKCMVIQC
jgi:hypothetical protein